MGAGIAHALLLGGAEVVLLERDPDASAAARGRVESAVQKSVDRGQVDDVAAVMARLSSSLDAADLAGAGLVVEAVPEDLDLKIATLQRVAEHVPDGTAIASNTSSPAVLVDGQADRGHLAVDVQPPGPVAVWAGYSTSTIMSASLRVGDKDQHSTLCYHIDTTALN
jgi:hypothetical protein